MAYLHCFLLYGYCYIHGYCYIWHKDSTWSWTKPDKHFSSRHHWWTMCIYQFYFNTLVSFLFLIHLHIKLLRRLMGTVLSWGIGLIVVEPEGVFLKSGEDSTIMYLMKCTVVVMYLDLDCAMFCNHKQIILFNFKTWKIFV